MIVLRRNLGGNLLWYRSILDPAVRSLLDLAVYFCRMTNTWVPPWTGGLGCFYRVVLFASSG
jgi:hypothetical protein